MTKSNKAWNKAVVLLAGMTAISAFGQQKAQGPVGDGPVRVEVTPDGSGVMTMPDGTQKSFGPNDGIVVDQADVASGRGAFTIAPGGAPASIDEFRQRAATIVKDQLKCTDDEWAVLEPRINAIQAIRIALGDTRGNSGGVKMMSITGGATQASGQSLPGNVNEMLAIFRAAQRDFRLALNNEQTNTERLTGLLEALRKSERTCRAELAARRSALRDVVTRRQEAQLYQMGILD